MTKWVFFCTINAHTHTYMLAVNNSLNNKT